LENELKELREEKREIENFAHECVERAKITMKELEVKLSAANVKIQDLQAAIAILEAENRNTRKIDRRSQKGQTT
jgi:hypothetical protein